MERLPKARMCAATQSRTGICSYRGCRLAVTTSWSRSLLSGVAVRDESEANQKLQTEAMSFSPFSPFWEKGRGMRAYARKQLSGLCSVMGEWHSKTKNIIRGSPLQ